MTTITPCRNRPCTVNRESSKQTLGTGFDNVVTRQGLATRPETCTHVTDTHGYGYGNTPTCIGSKHTAQRQNLRASQLHTRWHNNKVVHVLRCYRRKRQTHDFTKPTFSHNTNIFDPASSFNQSTYLHALCEILQIRG